MTLSPNHHDHQLNTRRWRGNIDVPLTTEGARQALRLRNKLALDAIYHDGLSRCADTARYINANIYIEDGGPGPWGMGELFEGRPITEGSLRMARWYINGNPHGRPPKGETFRTWEDRWMAFLGNLTYGFAAVGVVTHNRNIQYLYSLHNGKFIYRLYDVEGPGFCSVHYYDQRTGHIAPWGGKGAPSGIYLIRHGETSWGT